MLVSCSGPTSTSITLAPSSCTSTFAPRPLHPHATRRLQACDTVIKKHLEDLKLIYVWYTGQWERGFCCAMGYLVKYRPSASVASYYFWLKFRTHISLQVGATSLAKKRAKRATARATIGLAEAGSDTCVFYRLPTTTIHWLS